MNWMSGDRNGRMTGIRGERCCRCIWIHVFEPTPPQPPAAKRRVRKACAGSKERGARTLL